MNIIKSTSPVRLIAFFLIAVMLVCTFGFSVDGWTLAAKQNKPSTAPAVNHQNPTTSEDADSPTEPSPPEQEPEIYIPEHVNWLTGVETTEELASKRPIAVVMGGESATYSVSYSDILSEFPIEDGSTRLLAFFTDTSNLAKIGTIMPGRNYITNLSSYFDATTVCYGYDDVIDYSALKQEKSIFDLTENSGYHYSEYSQYQYTNSDLITAGIKNIGITTQKSDTTLPYSFNDFGNDDVKGDTVAESVQIAFSSSSVTKLQYSAEDGMYTYAKDGSDYKDLLNGYRLKFKNCLVLFADSVTYENSSGSQMVLDTLGFGMGYYFTGGSVCNITWRASDDGVMTIFDSTGKTLTVNRGQTYIAFAKSSRIQNVTFQ